MTDAELTEQDLADLETLDAPPRTLLETWTLILDSIEGSRDEKITPTIALKIVNSWPQLSFQDLAEYHELYHLKLIELRQAVRDIIKKHPKALKNTDQGTDSFGQPSKDSDPVANHALYVELLYQWQASILRWETDWNSSDSNSHIVLAAIADASAFFVGNQGLVQHLSEINFKFPEGEQKDLQARLLVFKETL